MSYLSRGVTRSGAVALLVLLGAGSGASAALADSAGGPSSQPARHAAKQARPQAVSAHPLHSAARHKAAHHRSQPDRYDADVAVTTSHLAVAPSSTATHEPVCGACLRLPSAASTKGLRFAAPAVVEPTATDVDPVDSVVVLSPVPEAPTVTPADRSPLAQALGSAAVVQLGSLPAARSVTSSPVAAVSVVRSQGGSGSVTRAAGKVTLPAQGPPAIDAAVALPAAAQADVPIFVALVGVLLLALGARKVGRFRRVGEDEAPDLSWD